MKSSKTVPKPVCFGCFSVFNMCMILIATIRHSHRSIFSCHSYPAPKKNVCAIHRRPIYLGIVCIPLNNSYDIHRCHTHIQPLVSCASYKSSVRRINNFTILLPTVMINCARSNAVVAAFKCDREGISAFRMRNHTPHTFIESLRNWTTLTKWNWRVTVIGCDSWILSHLANTTKNTVYEWGIIEKINKNKSL